jgi:hypothetical protein
LADFVIGGLRHWRTSSLADFVIGGLRHSTVTTFAKFFGLSGLIPRSTDK